MKLKVKFCPLTAVFAAAGLKAQIQNLIKFENMRQSINTRFGFSYGNTYPATTLAITKVAAN